VANPFGRIMSSIASLWNRYGGSGWGRVRLFLPGSTFDYEREAGPAWTNSIVGLGLKWLGDRFPQPPLRACKIGRNGDYVPLPRHPAVDRWNRPNPFYTRRTMEAAIGLSLVVDGNAWIYKQRSKGSREIVGLWWVRHDWVAPAWDERDPQSYLEGWWVQTEQGETFVPREDMIHVRQGIDPLNDRLGLSPMKAQLREVCSDNEASTFTASLLRNAGVPGLMIVPDQENLRPNEKDAEKIKETIKDRFGGDRRGEAIVLGGRYKVEQVGFSPEQLRLDRLPQRSQARIASAIGVAAMSLGLDDPNKTYSNLVEANRASWGSVTAMQGLVAETLRYDYLDEWDDPTRTVLEYDYTGISELNEDLKAKHERVREDWKADMIVLSSAQELLGYDVDPAGDYYYSQRPATATDAPIEPEAEVETPEPVAADAGENVQSTALNGGQITALTAIIQAVADGTMPAEAARPLIASTFPALPPEQIAAMIGAAEAFEPEPPEIPPGLPGGPPVDGGQEEPNPPEPPEPAMNGAANGSL
jgi:hypothetical protein